MEIKQISFSEYQGVLNWWIWAGLVGASIVFLLLMAWRIQKKQPKGGALVVHILFIGGGALLAIGGGFMMNLGMDTEITGSYVRARLSPWQRSYKEYDWEDITAAYLRPAAPHEWFGFGIPTNVANGVTVINFGSDIGLQLIEKDGGGAFIGTRDSAGMEAVLVELGFSQPVESE